MITRAKLSSIKQGLPNYRSMLAGNEAFSLGSFYSIASTTGTGSSATISFTSIPSTYQHLQLRWIAQSTDTSVTGNIALNITLNSDTGNNYAYHYVYGDGSVVTASGQTSKPNFPFFGGAWRSTSATNTYSVGIADIQDYAVTSKYKTLRTISGGDGNTGTASGQLFLQSALWMSSSAINSITLVANNGNFTTGSTFALYGLKGV